MNIKVQQKTVDILVDNAREKAHVVPGSPSPSGKTLRLYYSLIGDVKPLLSPLSLEFSFDNETRAYRYDWVVGFTPLQSTKSKLWDFDWRDDLTKNRALCVQMLIDCQGTGLSTAEISAVLLGLQPSKDTASWLERNADRIGESLVAGSDEVPFSATPAGLFKMSALFSNFIKSGEKGKIEASKQNKTKSGEEDEKDWFLYRFLDEKKGCSAVEWNIQKSVLYQYGPLLRGSLILTFHGTPHANKPIRILLRPRFRLAKAGGLNYVPPYEEMENENPVVLDVLPTLPGGEGANGRQAS